MGQLYILSTASRLFGEVTEIVKDSSSGIKICGYSTSFECTYRFYQDRNRYKKLSSEDQCGPGVPESILLINDITFEHGKLLNFLAALEKESPSVKTVIYTDAVDRYYFKDLISLDVKGILHKSETYLQSTTSEKYKMLYSLAFIYSGGHYYDRTVLNSILINQWSKGNSEIDFEGNKPFGSVDNLKSYLTRKDIELLNLIADSKPVSDIASALAVSVEIVEQHKNQLVKKLNFGHIGELQEYLMMNREIVKRL